MTMLEEENETSHVKYDLSPESLIFSLYKSLLKRQPEKMGLSYHLQQLEQGVSFAEVVQEFLDSEEFKSTLVRKEVVTKKRLDMLPANAVELNLSPAQTQSLWEHMAKVWSRLGRDDPYWSVITSEEFRRENLSNAEAIDRFYELGLASVEHCESYLARNGRVLPAEGLCVDYGCGVGRTTLWLARRCKRVLAVDVSQAHLDLARAALAERGVTNVDFHLVRSRSDLDLIRGFDFFYSMAVLEHNPPPLIRDILSAAFRGLNENGCVFVHVPTFSANYSFQYERYLEDTVPWQDMEMHLLPQSVIFALAAQAGCIPLEVGLDDWPEIPDWICNHLLFAKPRADTLR